jgi:hypothetical protein
MKNFITSILLFSLFALFTSCEKDEGKLPNISFKTDAKYISADATIAGGTDILIGINASKSESVDVLKKINISKSINGGTATSVFDKDLTGTEGDTYAYDYATKLEKVVGQTNKYTFTVTNRDGLVNQVSVTVTIK